MFARTLAHFFVPGYSNNHKAKLIHPSSLFLLSVVIVLYQLVLYFLPSTGARVLGYAANISPDEVIRLTNVKRAEAGLAPVQYNAALAQAARAKGNYMLEKDFWAHTAPDGTEPWKFFTDVGYRYRYAGENLARDFSNPQAAVDAWMASPSHRDNLLSPRYKEIGVAVVEGDLAGVDSTIIVQLFGTQLIDTTPQVPIAQAAAAAVSKAPLPTKNPVITITQTPSITPGATLTPIPSPTRQPEHLIAASGPDSGDTSPINKILISPFNTTRTISLVTIISLLSVMITDAVIAHRRKLPRIGGRTFAHLAFLAMITTLVLLARAGNII